jgi:hypothetical protein
MKKIILPIYRWQHLKKRGGELVVTHNRLTANLWEGKWNYRKPPLKHKNLNDIASIRCKKSRIQNPESKIQNPESRIQNPESRIQNPKSRIWINNPLVVLNVSLVASPLVRPAMQYALNFLTVIHPTAVCKPCMLVIYFTWWRILIFHLKSLYW